MQIITDLDQLPDLSSGCVVTMGDFDGIHRGHRILIDACLDLAKKKGLKSLLLTYEPSPKKILKKLALDSRLTVFAEKRRLLSASGIDHVVFYPMNPATLRISARSFLRHFLLDRLHMRHIVMGDDHHFGHNRRGNAAYLKAAARKYGFDAVIIEEQKAGDTRASSSRIRAALSTGDVELANQILGRPYSITGTVVRGEKRGRSLGFPTANLSPDPEKLLPMNGVYYGEAEWTGGRGPAIANLGRKPTVGEFSIGLEVHLLGYEGPEIYDQELTFLFSGYIRPEIRFSGIDALRRQIAADVETVKKKLSLI